MYFTPKLSPYQITYLIGLYVVRYPSKDFQSPNSASQCTHLVEKVKRQLIAPGANPQERQLTLNKRRIRATLPLPTRP